MEGDCRATLALAHSQQGDVFIGRNDDKFRSHGRQVGPDTTRSPVQRGIEVAVQM